MSTDKIIFGTAEYKGAVTGLVITSLKKGLTGSTAEAMDEDGNITQIDRYGKKKTVQIEANVKGDISALEVGAELTIDTEVYGIDTVDTTKTNTGHHTASISASAPVSASVSTGT